MIRKEIIDLISSKAKLAQRDLIEKDLILHQLLIELSSDRYFLENYAFKGGTCLMKCYLSYYRFSEDLDFTYVQSHLSGKSGKQIAKILSNEAGNVVKIIEDIANRIGLDFRSDKRNPRYVNFGGSNRQITLKLWYVPDGQTIETFIKVQINFLEELKYPVKMRHADSIFFGKLGKDNESAFLLPENSEWVLKIPELNCYDIREILVEKVRAILTRKGTKARDFIDVYMIEKNEKLKVEDFRRQIIDKTKFMLQFEKYKINLNSKEFNNLLFLRHEEERILLIPLPKDFEKFFGRFKVFLNGLLTELK